MDYLDLSVKVILEVKFLISQQILCDWSSPKIFLRLNKLQCEHLASKLEETQAYLQTQRFLPGHVTCGAAFKQLYNILKKAKTLVTKCCSGKWLLEAVSLMSTKEDVVDIILDLQWATKVVQIASLEFQEGRSSKLVQLEEAGKAYEDLIHSFQHNALQNEVLEDKHMLVTNLQEVKTKHGGSDHVTYKSLYLADYLLHRLGQSIQSSDDPPHFWPSWIPPEFEKGVQIGDLDQDTLGHNGNAIVIRVKWLGKDFVLKRLTQSSTSAETEAIILAANQHPHVVQLMCHWKKRTEYFITYMLMEKMDGDILKLMNQRKAQDIVPPFSLLQSVDIMLQVAKAMRFLHSKEVAHRDLKCQNILWKHGQFDQLLVKLGDFGVAKTNVKNSTMNQQQTWMVGTTGWRAPELSGEHMLTHKRYPLMADVFSFGMTFLEILTGETPFVGERNMNIQPRMNAGDRPDLPNECPPFLAFLIQSCWDANPRARPTFQQICMMLMHGKNLLMGMTFYENEDSIFAYTSLDGTLKCLKVVEHIMPRGNIFVPFRMKYFKSQGLIFFIYFYISFVLEQYRKLLLRINILIHLFENF
jgi:serine/threonine protein kinase